GSRALSRMTKLTLPGVAVAVAACSFTLAAQSQAPRAPKPQLAVAHKPAAPAAQPAAEPSPDLVKTYCVGCHNDNGKNRAGGLTLASFDAAHAEQAPEVAEKMIRKLRLGMMPPPGGRRPDAAAEARVR